MRKTQREALDALFRHLAWLRNDAVAHCRNEFVEGGKTPSTFDLYKRLTAMRQDNAHNAAQPVRAQRSMLQRVRAAYDKFFGEGKGRPRFKPEVRSFELEGTVPRKNGPYHRVQIKGVGKLRFKDKRGVLSGGNTVRLVRILRHPLGTGFNVQLVVQHHVVVIATDTRIGVDVGVKTNCSLSDGAQYAPLRLPERKRLQQAVSRAKRGSKTRRKKKLGLTRESHRLAVRRRSEVHRITTDIVKMHSAWIVVEDLRLQAMTARGGSRKRGLNRSMREQCLGMVMQQLVYKAESAGGELVKVKPHYISQTCSACGALAKDRLTLAVRTFVCSECGHRQDRDVNAARNIRLRGMELFGRVGGPACRTEAATAVNVVPLAASSDASKRGHDTGSCS